MLVNNLIMVLMIGLEVPNNAKSKRIVAKTPSIKVILGLVLMEDVRRTKTCISPEFSWMRSDQRLGRMARMHLARHSPIANANMVLVVFVDVVDDEGED